MSRTDDLQPQASEPDERHFLFASEIIDNLSEGFVTLDREWRYTYVNLAAAEIIGQPRDELIGKTVWEFFPGSEDSPVVEAWRRAMHEGVTGRSEMYYPGGGWIEEYVYPAEEGIWVFLKDITARKAREKEFEEATAALEGQIRKETLRRERAERDLDRSIEAIQWSTFLAEAEQTFTASLDDKTILNDLVRLAVPKLADAAGAMIEGKDGFLHHVAIALHDPEEEEPLLNFLAEHPLSPDLDLGAPRSLRTGKAEILPTLEDEELRSLVKNEEAYRFFRDFGVTSGITAPLIARGKTLGVIWLISTDPDHQYDSADLSRVRDLAGRAALAVDNAMLYKELQRAERNARFVAEAGVTLAASLDYEVSLQNLARLITTTLADYCIIDIVGNKKIERIATAHVDEELDHLLEKTKESPPDLRNTIWRDAIENEEAQIFTEVTDTDLEMLASSDEHLEILRRLDPTSIMLIPLTARGHTFGIITLSITDGNHYDLEDLALAEDLALRVALLIDNARLYREALDANRAKSDFLAVISHELRTPLNAIMGYTDLLRAEVSGPLNETQSDQLHRIDLSARHLLDLIEEVLTFSRMEMGEEDLELRSIDLVPLLREVGERVEPLARNKGLGLEIELPTSPVIAQTDPPKVRQIITNLLSNAIKFTDTGEISLRARVEGDEIVIDVEDTGIGIEPTELGRLFEPFWQHESGTTRRVSGTGLGLSVSQRLADLLGGRISVESEVGAGTIFTLHLPLDRNDG